MSRRLTAITAITAIALIAGLSGCSSAEAGADTTGAEAETDAVRIGVVGKGDPQWAAFEKAAAAEGIDVEIIDFGSYEQPNPALAEGELDLNQFQHIVYLAQYNAKNDGDLQPIGATAIYPLGLYSTKYADVDDIPAGGTVVVPDDASNQARALLVLQSAGLIELKSGGTIVSDIADIDTARSKVSVSALEAAVIPTSLPDVDAAIINNDFVEDAGLTFDDAIAQDDPSDPNALPYANVFAARAEDVDNETFRTLVDIFQTDAEVQKGLLAASGGTGVPLTTPASDLQASLKKVLRDTGN